MRRGGQNCGAKLRELSFKTAGENREPAPAARVQILVVYVQRGSESLALPLVAAPQNKEP